ncbi:putative P-loop containing nucleoside triphosphate hydrolase [Helianthus anomalus]
MEIRVNRIVSSLEIGLDDVRMIGIKGIGGGGKTTLATAVFEHISIWFEGASFVENVREASKSSLFGLKELQKQLLSDVLNVQGINVKNLFDGKNQLRRAMSTRKVLVVLDDVDCIDQLEALVGERTWFKQGSRIIITTRDEQVFAKQQVNYIHDPVCIWERDSNSRL